MEGNHRSETGELRGSKLDASALTAGSDRGFVCFPATLNDNAKWTDETHHLYINHLESSFVKELHHSINSLPEGRGQNQRGKSISEMEPFHVSYTSNQFPGVHYGNWQMTNFKGGNLDASTDYHGSSKNLEGTGQNFVDEDNHNKSNAGSRPRRMR